MTDRGWSSLRRNHANDERLEEKRRALQTIDGLMCEVMSTVAGHALAERLKQWLVDTPVIDLENEKRSAYNEGEHAVFRQLIRAREIGVEND